jgi:division protein CdvB (Snf7/Vps24/ESCRT-III family)
MSKKFVKDWEKQQKKGVGARIKEAILPQKPLKNRLAEAANILQEQIRRLEAVERRMEEKDESIFKKVTDALAKHQTESAATYSSELAEVRNTTRQIVQAKLALEQVVLRLRTVQEVGDLAVLLVPTISVIESVKWGVADISPEAQDEFGAVGSMLNNVLFEFSQSSSLSLDFRASNEEAQKILDEAASVAETQMKSKLPPLPEDAGEAEAAKD